MEAAADSLSSVLGLICGVCGELCGIWWLRSQCPGRGVKPDVETRTGTMVTSTILGDGELERGRDGEGGRRGPL